MLEIARQRFLAGLDALALARDRAKRVVKSQGERGETNRHAASTLTDRLALRGLGVLCRLIAAWRRTGQM